MPFAYRLDDHGLDLLANAGYPATKWWRDILVLGAGGDHPLADKDGNVYSKTAYEWKGRPAETRYVDSASVPYAVVNPIVRKAAKGIVLGSRVKMSFEGKSVEGVVADVSGSGRIGELSIAAAKALGIPASPRSGGVDSGVLYEIWPGTPATVNGETYELQPV